MALSTRWRGSYQAYAWEWKMGGLCETVGHMQDLCLQVVWLPVCHLPLCQTPAALACYSHCGQGTVPQVKSNVLQSRHSSGEPRRQQKMMEPLPSMSQQHCLLFLSIIAAAISSLPPP